MRVWLFAIAVILAFATEARARTYRPKGIGQNYWVHTTPNGNLAWVWGCGTNCHAAELDDGRTHHRILALASASLDESPTHDRWITGPSMLLGCEPLRVFNLVAGRKMWEMDICRQGPVAIVSTRWGTHSATIVLQGTTARRTITVPL